MPQLGILRLQARHFPSQPGDLMPAVRLNVFKLFRKNCIELVKLT